MKPHRILACLLLAVALAAVSPGQQDLRDPFAGWKKSVDVWRKWEKEESARAAKGFREAAERLQPLWLMLETQDLQGENQFRAAIAKAEQAVQQLEQKPPGKRAPMDRFVYREALLQLAGLYAVSGEQEPARARALQAWEVHQRLPSAADPRQALPVALTIGFLMEGIEQPEEAREFVTRALNSGPRRLPGPLTRLESNPLLAQAHLLQSLLANDAGNYRAARQEAEQVLAAFRKQYSSDDLRIALALATLGRAEAAVGETSRARSHLRQADDILKLKKHAARGKLLRADVYLQLGQLDLQRQRVGSALDSLAESRKLVEEMFPPAQYPHSHPALLQALACRADLLCRFQRASEAVPLAQKAWKQCQRRYTGPHAQQATTLLTYGRCMRDTGQLGPARERFEQAEGLARALHAAGKRPQDQALLASCQLHLGSLLGRQGEVAAARKLFHQAQATYRLLYPEGHPYLQATATYLGLLALRQGNASGAREAFAQALELEQQQLQKLARAAAEIEVLTYSPLRLFGLNGYLSASRDQPTMDEQAFAWVWAARNAATRLAQARRAAVQMAAARDPRVRQFQAALVDTCIRLRQELTKGRTGTGLVGLVKERDRLELELAKLWPQTDWQAERQRFRPAALPAALPPGSAYIDFVRYDDLAARPMVQPRYAAFLVRPGMKPRRIELGPARPIDDAVNAWLNSVARWNPQDTEAVQGAWEKESDEQAVELRKRVWQPIHKLLPPGTRLLILAADGDLARFPFAALPGARPQSVLLEEFTIAYVPHGPFLLERLRQGDNLPDHGAGFLAVGAVRYSPPGAGGGPYPFLPGTGAEIELVQSLAAGPHLQILREHAATVAAVGAGLAEVREADIATHAFFDKEGLEEERRELARALRDWTPALEPALGPVGLGQHFPLSYTGLVLAGANVPAAAGPGRGILTGEAIAQLPLGGLRCVVLSACETGLGAATAGEGVQGLERAFHLAGCPNVVASLWPVDDKATQALMEAFYQYERQKKLPTLEALRQAQLALYHNPALALAGARRGLPVVTRHAEPEVRVLATAARRSRSHPRLWAAFVHSGIGYPVARPAELPASVVELPIPPAPAAAEKATPETAAPAGISPSLLGLGLAGLIALAVFAVWRRRHRRAPVSGAGPGTT